jgi:acetoin:2,6-dichlorophenolindophenol oxidoreductase subunit alpha
MARGKRAAAPRRPDRDATLRLLATMWRIRCFEERVARLHRSLLVHGLVHLSTGGEGVAAAVCGQLEDRDAIYSGHRAHGHALAKGAPMDRVMAELMGRSDGLCRGLGGSMHLVDSEHGLMGATGVVGGNLPLAAGDALASKLRGTDQVTVVFFGDGAVQAGHFNETVNLAALWELPLIFVCENNGFAEFTPRSAHTKVARVCDVVAPYDFERAFGDYLDAARAGRGPLLLECMTHRRSGHYEGDSQGYRDALADAEWAKVDPLAQLQAHATAEAWLTPEAAQGLEREARAEVEAAVEFARASPYPEPQVVAEMVYATAGGD